MSGWWILAVIVAGLALVAFGFVLGWQQRGIEERLEAWHRELANE